VKIDHAINDVQDAENQLGTELRRIGERHAVEHDLYHLGHILARQCDAHLAALAPAAERYGVSLSANDVGESSGIIESFRRTSAQMMRRAQAPGMLLLRDLRNLYLNAQEAELAWVILIQVAKAARDPALLEVATSCCEDAEIRGKWLRTRIKEAAPQILVAG